MATLKKVPAWNVFIGPCFMRRKILLVLLERDARSRRLASSYRTIPTSTVQEVSMAFLL
jgi:hypothetical protein